MEASVTRKYSDRTPPSVTIDKSTGTRRNWLAKLAADHQRKFARIKLCIINQVNMVGAIMGLTKPLRYSPGGKTLGLINRGRCKPTLGRC